MLGLAATPAPYWTNPFVREGMSSRSMRTKFLRGKIYFSKRGRLMARHESRNFKVAELRSCNLGGFHTMSTSISQPTSPITVAPSTVCQLILFFSTFFPFLSWTRTCQKNWVSWQQYFFLCRKSKATQ